jgi:hypothetical protein
VTELLWFYCDACDQFYAIPDPTGHWKQRIENGDLPVCPDRSCDEEVEVFLGRGGITPPGNVGATLYAAWGIAPSADA